MTTPKKSAKKAPSKAKAAAPQVTAASAWNKPEEVVQGHLLTLPSGNVARLRRTLNLPTLLRQGKIPNPLASQVDKMIREKKPSIAATPDDTQMLMQMVQLINSQLPKIFIEPRVEAEPAKWDEDIHGEWEPSEGAISVEWLTPEDAMFAFAFAQGGPAEVASFREQQEQIVADLVDEQGVEAEAK